MTNASCADCGRIVAFRTQDLSEIAECQNCGTWVKRSAEMPGVAVSVKSSGPVARKTAIPPRKDEVKRPPNPNINTTRSANKRASKEAAQKLTESSSGKSGSDKTSNAEPTRRNTKDNGDHLSAASVYASIRELQKSVHDLRAGQKNLQSGQKSLLADHKSLKAGQQSLLADHKNLQAGQQSLQAGQQSLQAGQKSLLEDHSSLKAGQQSFQKTQKALHEGQKALSSGQKQLSGQLQELRTGQNELLEHTLAIPEMPVAPARQDAGAHLANAIPNGPLSSFDDNFPLEENAFSTTPFSSLKIPLIPIKLEDLDINPQFTEEGSVPTIPVDERSDRIGLIENPLPEPPPYVEPEVVEEPEEEEPADEKPAPELSPFVEASFNDSVFDEVIEPEPVVEPVVADFAQAESSPFSLPSEPETAAETTAETADEEQKEDWKNEAEEEVKEVEEEGADHFLTTAAHQSPFTIEGPPTDPFSIAELGDETEAADKADKDPFKASPIPFGAKEYKHEPCEIDDPFAPATADSTANEASPDSDATVEGKEQSSPFKEQKSLSQQIADAKKQQGTKSLDPTQPDLLTEPRKSKLIPIIGVLLALLVALGALLFFFTDLFKAKEVTTTPPVVELPIYGVPLPKDDARIAEAEQVATQFLNAKTQKEIEAVIRPVDKALLVNFWEPMSAATIQRMFQGRILSKGRVEVDFLVKDFGREERLLPLIKIGDGPFQVDWKSFTECEEVTLLSLAQGTLILDNGEEINEGSIRSWMQSGKEMTEQPDLKNYVGFKLHNFTEEVVAFAIARSGSPELKQLTEAFSSTELKHKGKPAIRAVLKVERIEKEDPENKKPARLEILKVLSTDWTNSASEKEALDKEQLAPTTTNQPNQKKANPEATPTKKQALPKQVPKLLPKPRPTNKPQPKPQPQQPAQLPPVPAIDAPLSYVEGESPLFQLDVE